MSKELTTTRLAAFYQIHDAGKVAQAQAIMEMYSGQGKKLVQMLEVQYNVAWDSHIPGFDKVEEGKHDTHHALTNSALGMMLEDIAKQTGDISNLFDESWKGRGKRKKQLKKMQDALDDRLYEAETGVKVASRHSEISVDCCAVSTFDMSGNESIADLPLYRLMLEGLTKAPCFENFIQLSLQDVGLTAAHVNSLAPLLQERGNIQRLNLSGNPITRGILRPSKTMVKPYLQDDYTIDMSGLHMICQAMKTTFVISHLYLANCFLDFEATRDLLKAILSNEAIIPPSKPLLRKLDLSNNIIGSKVRQNMVNKIEEALNDNKLPRKTVFLCDQDEEPEVQEDEEEVENENYGGGYEYDQNQSYDSTYGGGFDEYGNTKVFS